MQGQLAVLAWLSVAIVVAFAALVLLKVVAGRASRTDSPNALRPMVLAILLLGSSCTVGQTSSDREPSGHWILIFDNDGFGIPTSSDRSYTMGMSITRTQQGIPEGPPLPRGILNGLASFNKWTRLEEIGARDAPTWLTFGSTNFTPKDITIAEPIQGDRPYASLLYLGVGYALDRGSHIFESEFQLGLLGTDMGEEVQTAIHRVCCKDRIPAGWENQIGDGGSPTFLYAVRASRQLSGNAASFASFPYELRIGGGGEVGWYTRALGMVTFLLGGSPADLDMTRVGVITGGHRQYRTYKKDDMTLMAKRRTDTTGFAIWANYELSAFAYNQLLQGAWFGSNPVTIPRDQMETVVHHASLGLELTFIPRAFGLLRDSHLYLTQQWRSKDLKTTFGTSQHYGGFTFVWPAF